MKKRISIFIALFLCMAMMVENIAYANEQEEQDDIDARTMVIFNTETGEVTYDIVDEVTMIAKVEKYNLNIASASEENQLPEGRLTLNRPYLVDSEEVKETPYCAIGRVDANFPEGYKYGTATMLPGNLALTSAHVVYDLEKDKFSNDVLFKPRYTIGNMSGGKRPNNILIPLKFTRDHDDAYDYALLAYDYDLGIGTIGLAFSDDYSTHDGRLMHLVGYEPGKDMGMYSQYGRVTSSNYSYLFSDMATEKGWSGGPLLENDKYVVGVLKGRWGTKARMVRITEEIFNMIVSYM